jgi:transcriptional regulator with GAF, ATPase, and Fis domain
LRDRVDDIAPLARFFVQRFAERQGRARLHLTDAALGALQDYEWPGNVRELQNVLERAVILARGDIITPDLLVLEGSIEKHAPAAAEPISPHPIASERPSATVISFSEAERRAILRALEMTGWRISGRGGAADLLGLKPTTLHAKMKRLGVHRPRPPIDSEPPPLAS